MSADNKPDPKKDPKEKDVRISDKQAKAVEKLMEKLEEQEKDKPVVPPIPDPKVDPKDQTIKDLQDKLNKSQIREKANLLVQFDEESQKKYSKHSSEQLQLLLDDRKGRGEQPTISDGLPRIPPTDQTSDDPTKDDGYIGSFNDKTGKWE